MRVYKRETSKNFVIVRFSLVAHEENERKRMTNKILWTNIWFDHLHASSVYNHRYYNTT